MLTIKSKAKVDGQVEAVQVEAVQVEAVQVGCCEVCSRLRNLWLTGEWACPRCGPLPVETAARLREEYVAGGAFGSSPFGRMK
jgi:hypothetical protein